MIGLKMYIPQSLKKISPKKFIAELLKDKKTINNEITFILIQKIGKALIKKKYSYNRLIKLFKEITT
jgi:3-dehydroquinate synthetase